MNLKYCKLAFTIRISFFLASLVLVLSTSKVQAQWEAYDGLEFEVVHVHDGIEHPEIPLGFVTYKVYVRMQNPTDFLSAVFALPPNDIYLTTTTSFWHDPLDSDTQIGCNNPCSFSLTMEYDTFVSIDKQCSGDPGIVLAAFAFPEFPLEDFLNGEDLQILDGAWFTSNGSVNGVAGPDLRVLIGNFTTDGNVSLCVNLQLYPLGNSMNPEQVVDQCIAFGPGCDLFEFEADVVVQDVGCNNENSGMINAVVDPDILGYSYELYQGNVNEAVYQLNEDGNFDELASGTYALIAINPWGCRDTISDIVINVSNLPIELELLEISENVCIGSPTGQIEFNVINQSDPISVLINGFDVGNQTSFEGLICGTYNFEVTDALGCTAESEYEIVCNEELDVNLTVVGSYGDDGSVTIDVESGTPPYTYYFDDIESDDYIENLAPGIYEVTVVDAMGCTASFEFEVLLLVEVTETNHDVINVYPNPFNSTLTIDNSSVILDEIVISDLSGREIFRQFQNSDKCVINTLEWASGMYILKYRFNNINYYLQIVHEQ